MQFRAIKIFMINMQDADDMIRTHDCDRLNLGDEANSFCNLEVLDEDSDKEIRGDHATQQQPQKHHHRRVQLQERTS